MATTKATGTASKRSPKDGPYKPSAGHRLAFGSESDMIWCMSRFQITSIDEPIAPDAETSVAIARLVTRVDFLGMLSELEGAQVINRDFLTLIFSRLNEVGIAREGGVLLAAADRSGQYRSLIERALEETEHSPMPSIEWAPLLETLGEDNLAGLVGISPASVKRYSRQDRPTPDEVANRLHFLALLVADLSGSYNSYGIRRWFSRPRHALGGHTPSALLGAGFEPSSDDAAALRRLAGELVGAGAA